MENGRRGKSGNRDKNEGGSGGELKQTVWIRT
jgi:hypothetical protein